MNRWGMIERALVDVTPENLEVCAEQLSGRGYPATALLLEAVARAMEMPETMQHNDKVCVFLTVADGGVSVGCMGAACAQWNELTERCGLIASLDEATWTAYSQRIKRAAERIDLEERRRCG